MAQVSVRLAWGDFLAVSQLDDLDLEFTSQTAGAADYRAYNQTYCLNSSLFSSCIKRAFQWSLLHMFRDPRGPRSIPFPVSVELYKAMASIPNVRTSREPKLMHLAQRLLMSAVRFHFTFATQNIPSLQNVIAGTLSHFNWHEFQWLASRSLPAQVPVPHWLLTDLMSPL